MAREHCEDQGSHEPWSSLNRKIDGTALPPGEKIQPPHHTRTKPRSCGPATIWHTSCCNWAWHTPCYALQHDAIHRPACSLDPTALAVRRGDCALAWS